MLMGMLMVTTASGLDALPAAGAAGGGCAVDFAAAGPAELAAAAGRAADLELVAGPDRGSTPTPAAVAATGA